MVQKFRGDPNPHNLGHWDLGSPGRYVAYENIQTNEEFAIKVLNNDFREHPEAFICSTIVGVSSVPLVAITIRSMVLKDGMRLVGVGLGLGLAGTLAASGLLASQLFGVNPRDPVVLGTVAGVLLVSGLLASLVPAWRATRVDPVVAMKAE